MYIDADSAPAYIAGCEKTDLFISDDKDLLAKAKEKGLAVNDPEKMKESFSKAMEMLKAYPLAVPQSDIQVKEYVPRQGDL